MSRRLRREGESATALAALDNAYLQGIVQIIDTALARDALDVDAGPILALLSERGLFSQSEMAEMGVTQGSNILRWSKGRHIPRENRTLFRVLDTARGILARRVMEGLERE
jgi:hypothetical protein